MLLIELQLCVSGFWLSSHQCWSHGNLTTLLPLDWFPCNSHAKTHQVQNFGHFVNLAHHLLNYKKLNITVFYNWPIQFIVYRKGGIVKDPMKSVSFVPKIIPAGSASHESSLDRLLLDWHCSKRCIFISEVKMQLCYTSYCVCEIVLYLQVTSCAI